MIETLEAAQNLVQKQLQVMGDSVSPELIEVGTETASKETGVVFPLNNIEEEYWLIRRGMRHCFFSLQIESAKKFKIGSMHLQQRFDHYKSLISKEDWEFKEALENNPFLFKTLQQSVSGKDFITYIQNFG